MCFTRERCNETESMHPLDHRIKIDRLHCHDLGTAQGEDGGMARGR